MTISDLYLFPVILNISSQIKLVFLKSLLSFLATFTNLFVASMPKKLTFFHLLAKKNINSPLPVPISIQLLGFLNFFLIYKLAFLNTNFGFFKRALLIFRNMGMF